MAMALFCPAALLLPAEHGQLAEEWLACGALHVALGIEQLLTPRALRRASGMLCGRLAAGRPSFAETFSASCTLVGLVPERALMFSIGLGCISELALTCATRWVSWRQLSGCQWHIEPMTPMSRLPCRAEPQQHVSPRQAASPRSGTHLSHLLAAVGPCLGVRTTRAAPLGKRRPAPRASAIFDQRRVMIVARTRVVCVPLSGRTSRAVRCRALAWVSNVSCVRRTLASENVFY